MKVINDLLGFNLKIIQDTDYFNFSLDSVLLYNFLKLKKNMNIIDLCSGNCPIPLIISNKVNKKALIFSYIVGNTDIPIQLMLILDGAVINFRIFIWFKRLCIFLQFPQVLNPFSFSFFLEVLYLL